MKSVRTRRRRRGFTLIEMVVVISMAATILLVAARCLHTICRQNVTSHAFVADNQQWLQLSEAFRRDAHRARSAELSADSKELQLFFAEKVAIRYKQMANGVERIDPTVAEKPRTDRFPLWKGTASFRLSQEAPRRATIEYHWLPETAAAALDAGQSPRSKELRLDAIVGSDHRYEAKP